jgi:EAL domain-containing protein (putative c-di-GMP-specific phosphodiesterase class I)/GGDEF domain-containing protein
MRTFRNRLLILIIGLVLGAQTVTLVASLARTESLVQERASEQLSAGSLVARELIGSQARQLANAVTVLAADFGLREAVALGDAATIESAVSNHGARIGAQLMIVLDVEGRPVSVTGTRSALDSRAAAVLIAEADDASTDAHFLELGDSLYQVIVTPLQAPDLIGWVALGFVIDDRFARQIGALVDVDVTLLAADGRGARLAASTLQGAARDALLAAAPALLAATTPQRIGTDDAAALASAVRLSSGGVAVHVALQKPMLAVNAPYTELARTLFAIVLVTALASIALAWFMGRSAVRPVDRLVEGARRISRADYSTPVVAGGGEELERLASTFNAMQSGIAEREARIVRFATHDAVTGLPNRRHAEEWITQQLVGDDAMLALLVVRVTNLPELSTTLGAPIADDAIRELGHRLQLLGGSKPLVARIDGAHLLYAERGLGAARAELVAADALTRVGTALRLAHIAVQPALACGVSLAPEHGRDGAELLRRAEAALELAETRPLRVAIFDPATDQAQRRRLQLGADLPAALEADQLSIVFQPKVAFDRRRIVSAEVLTRWRHPTFGFIAPPEFVEVAEQTGASGLLSRWVLRRALRELAGWSRDGFEMDIAVNLSAADIIDPTLPEYILGELAQHGIAASRLILEITESAFMRDAGAASRHMEHLRVTGVRFSIDDFGTGYSSLSQLQKLPVDELKIDRSFIVAADQDPDNIPVVRTIIELGHSLGLKVVAEGVETEAHWRWLAGVGCDIAQGYLISKPVAAHDFAQLCADTRARLGEDPTATQFVREFIARGGA